MLNGYQLEAARVAVWLCARAGAAAGGWIEARPCDLAGACGLGEGAARRAVAHFVALGYVALEKRGGAFWLQPTSAGRGPLAAYVLGFAEERLTNGD